MFPLNHLAMLTIDYREKPSGIPDLLLKQEMPVSISQLKTGDYQVNDQLLIERKSAEDFVISLISGRLFNQCARLSRSALRPLLLLEGDPFQTGHQIDPNAVKGALLSVITSWQIPVIYTRNHKDTADQLTMLARQAYQKEFPIRLNGYKSKRIQTQRFRFLQGLPKVGAVMAHRLHDHFGSVEAVVNASVEELQQVKGMGKKGAEKIRKFITGE